MNCVVSGTKLQIYKACVLSKLLYNLPSMWLNAAEVCKLDAFHVRCLRRMLRIQPSFYNRVSNQTVLTQARNCNLSQTLLERQLFLMGEVATRPDSDLLKRIIFHLTL